MPFWIVDATLVVKDCDLKVCGPGGIELQNFDGEIRTTEVHVHHPPGLKVSKLRFHLSYLHHDFILQDERCNAKETYCCTHFSPFDALDITEGESDFAK